MKLTLTTNVEVEVDAKTMGVELSVNGVCVVVVFHADVGVNSERTNHNESKRGEGGGERRPEMPTEACGNPRHAYGEEESYTKNRSIYLRVSINKTVATTSATTHYQQQTSN